MKTDKSNVSPSLRLKSLVSRFLRNRSITGLRGFYNDENAKRQARNEGCNEGCNATEIRDSNAVLARIETEKVNR